MEHLACWRFADISWYSGCVGFSTSDGWLLTLRKYWSACKIKTQTESIKTIHKIKNMHKYFYVLHGNINRCKTFPTTYLSNLFEKSWKNKFLTMMKLLWNSIHIYWINWKFSLTNFMSWLLYISSENIIKPRYSDVFWGYRKRPVAWNMLEVI